MGTSNISWERQERFAIREVIDRFYDASNHHEWDVLDEVFTEDAVWEALAPYHWRLEGRDGIKKGLASNLEKVEVLLQTVTPISIQLHGPDRATARSTLNELLRLKDTGAALQIVGTYADELVKKDGAWRFARRRFQVRYEDDVPVPERLFGRAAPSPARSSPLGAQGGTRALPADTTPEVHHAP